MNNNRIGHEEKATDLIFTRFFEDMYLRLNLPTIEYYMYLSLN